MHERRCLRKFNTPSGPQELVCANEDLLELVFAHLDLMDDCRLNIPRSRSELNKNPAMRLGCALVGCDENPVYLDFWPLVHEAWSRIGVVIKMVLIAPRLPIGIAYPHDVIVFEPLPQIPTAWTAQVVRIFYPALLSTRNAVIITDMDMAPMSRTYFHDALAPIESETFFCYRDILRHEGMLPICYNAARPRVWARVTGATTLAQVRQQMISLYQENSRWTTDQEELLRLVLSSGVPFVGKQDNTPPNFLRLDRADKEVMDETGPEPEPGNYCDFHMLRPPSRHYERNRALFERLAEAPVSSTPDVGWVILLMVVVVSAVWCVLLAISVTSSRLRNKPWNSSSAR